MACSSCFYVSQAPSCQWLLLWTVPGASPTVPFWLAIIQKKGEGKLRRSGKHGSNLFFHWIRFCQGRQRLLWFTGVRSATWLWFSHAAQMLGSGCALPHMVPLTLRGRENKWFVFLLWSHSLRTYKTGFWRLDTCACVEPDISWYVSMECVAFPFKLIVFSWVQFYTNTDTD